MKLLPTPSFMLFGIGVFKITGKSSNCNQTPLGQGEAGPVCMTSTLAIFSGPATRISLALASSPPRTGPQGAAGWPLDTLH